MNALDVFPDIEELEPASQFLSACFKELPHSLDISPDLCMTILSKYPSRYEELKVAHQARDMRAVDHLCAYVQRNAWRFNPQFSVVKERMREIESGGRIPQVARGEWRRSIWTPRQSSHITEITSHIQSLQIPRGSREDVPLVILYKLGSFQHDPTLWKRLDQIFSPLRNTFLVNTSGSGKTRLLFEGLCLHWGLYFTCALDSSSLGSSDIDSVLQHVKDQHSWTPYLPSASDPNYTSSLEANIQIIHKISGEALLERLLMLKMYLEVCSQDGFCHDHRQRWLESQIFTRNLMPSFDPFTFLNREINNACMDDATLDEAIMYTLEDIQSIWDMPPGEFFYIVLDEANVGSRMYENAFSDEYGNYPILKEIIRSWQRRMGHLPVKFVVAGTVIPQEHFQSATGEWDDFTWSSDTGSFDNPETHRDYVSQFIPQEVKVSVMGQSLLDRMWQWLQGRHRYTASFLTVILDSNFESPHTLLGNYIERVTGYNPHDNVEFSHDETPRYNRWYTALSCKGLQQTPISVIEMHRAVVSYLTTSAGIGDCTITDRILVTYDYGRFVDENCSQIALDEPLTVVHGANWLQTTSFDYKITSFNTFGYEYGTEVRASHFTLFLAMSFASFFDGLFKLSEAFTIFGLPAPLRNAKAKLVTYKKTGPRLKAVDAHFTEDAPPRLVLMAETPEDVGSWFKHERDEPFCVMRCTSSSSVTLVFCLELSDARSFWVFVRVPSTFLERETPDFARDVEDIDPNEIFRTQPEILPMLNELPNICLGVGPLGVLRVSGSFWVEKATKKSFTSGVLPAAILNVKGLQKAGKEVSQDMLIHRLSHIIARRKYGPIRPLLPGVESKSSLTAAIVAVAESSESAGIFPSTSSLTSTLSAERRAIQGNRTAAITATVAKPTSSARDISHPSSSVTIPSSRKQSNKQNRKRTAEPDAGSGSAPVSPPVAGNRTPIQTRKRNRTTIEGSEPAPIVQPNRRASTRIRRTTDPAAESSHSQNSSSKTAKSHQLDGSTVAADGSKTASTHTRSRIVHVATGRASPGIPRSTRVRASSSSATRYNLRDRSKLSSLTK